MGNGSCFHGHTRNPLIVAHQFISIETACTGFKAKLHNSNSPGGYGFVSGSQCVNYGFRAKSEWSKIF